MPGHRVQERSCAQAKAACRTTLARRSGHGDAERFASDTGGSAAPVPIPINFNEVEIGAVLITR